jgi:hypothetical protein
MTLQIISISDAGNIERERLVLRATIDMDIGKYAIFSCRITSKGKAIAGVIPHAFWLFDREVKENDLVILYTKAGVISKKVNSNSTTSYFYYWNLSDSIWSPSLIPVLVNTISWKAGARVLDESATSA